MDPFTFRTSGGKVRASDDLAILVPAAEMDKNTDYSTTDRYSINNILIHTVTAVINGTYPFL
jgi:hypothetical protein